MPIYDLHTHSTFSDGDASPEQLLALYAARGYQLGIADHVFCPGLNESFAQIETYFDALQDYPLLIGVEANIGAPIQWPERLLTKFDYVIASVHAVQYKGEQLWLSPYFGQRAGHRPECRLDYDRRDSRSILEDLLRRIEATFSASRVDILGHCTVLPFYEDLNGTVFLDQWEGEIIALCQKYRVAIEISGLWREPGRGFLEKALRAEVQFSFGSDCHRFAETGDLEYPLQMLTELPEIGNRLYVPSSRRFMNKAKDVS